MVLVALTGCSFLTMRSPHGTPPECTESRTAPVLDTIVTGALPIVAYAIISANTDDSINPPPGFVKGIGAFIISLPVMLGTGASAMYGFVRAQRCERAKRDYQQLMSAPPPAYPMGPPPAR